MYECERIGESCALHHVTAMVEMEDGYVPGTPFADFWTVPSSEAFYNMTSVDFQSGTGFRLISFVPGESFLGIH
jgi:hypothetical protein